MVSDSKESEWNTLNGGVRELKDEQSIGYDNHEKWYSCQQFLGLPT